MKPFEYWVFVKSGSLPSGREILKSAWGDLPTNYFFWCGLNLNKARYFSADVRRWEFDRRWSKVPGFNPTVFVYFYRRRRLRSQLTRKNFPFSQDMLYQDLVAVTLDGDVDYDQLDIKTAYALAVAFARGEPIYGFDENGMHYKIDSTQTNESLLAEIKSLLVSMLPAN